MIQWYPGHMTKSMRMIEENLKLVDAVVYVLDARAPFSCMNPNFAPLIARLPVVYALNKAELGDSSRVKQWVAKLTEGNRAALALTGTASKSAAPLVSMITRLCGEKLARYRRKGVRTTVKAMVLGVPNTGKSTLINTLCGSAKTTTGNRPGVTRGKQWVRVHDFLEVLDTPGTLYPKLSDQRIARRLAFLGSIRDEVVDTRQLAAELVDELNAIDEKLIQTRYGLHEAADGDATIRAVAARRGYLLRGGETDDDRAATAVLDDFRKGRIGAVTFDTTDECL